MLRMIKSQSRIKCEERLTQGKEGDIITAVEMSHVLGLPCDGAKYEGWKVVYRAAKCVEVEHQLFWRWDRKGKFWKCLTNDEKPRDMALGLDRIKRKSRDIKRVGHTVEYRELSDEQRATAAVSFVLAGAIECLTRPRNRAKLQGDVNAAFFPDETTLLNACKARVTK